MPDYHKTVQQSFKSMAVAALVHKVIKTFCTIDNREIARIPQKGPLIIVLNHINFLEVPLIYLELLPRITTGMVKKETWKNIFLGFLGNLWGAIPLDRNSTDFYAFRRALDLLKAGGILLVAPEGTRSIQGRLLKGQAGVVSLALHSQAPMLPLVHYGGEQVWSNLSRIKKTRLSFKAGRPFRLICGAEKVTSQVRELMIDEIMYQMALLLPAEYRGHYDRIQRATTHYLEFLPELC